MRLAIAQPVVGEEELAAVTRAMRRGEISRGRSVTEFEKCFELWITRNPASHRSTPSRHAVSVASGTAAVEVSLRALGLEGSEVVTGAISCQATANALLAAGCRIRFADHDPDSWQVSPASVARLITPGTKAIVVAHLFGASADMDAFTRLARKRKVALIEDCCQSMGARWRGRSIGTFGASASFSFYANKLITTGEGGIVIFKSKGAADKARSIRNHGQDGPFHHVRFGLNWKMPNILCALGTAQMKRAERLAASRREREHILREIVSSHPDILLPVHPPEMEPAPFCFPVVLRRGNAAAVRAELDRRGIETRPIFPPQCDQPYWMRSAGRSRHDIPMARRIASHGLYLPTSPHLTIVETRRIGRTLLKALDHVRG